MPDVHTLPPLSAFQASPDCLLRAFARRGGDELAANRRPALAEPLFRLVEHTGSNRAEVERFISERFFESFGSRVQAFMPRLFSLRGPAGVIHGAFGLRSAQRRLFLEQYLDLPVDRAIAARTGGKVERGGVVEVGHFSGSFPGAVRAMICLLTEQLQAENVEWVAFTGTMKLRNAFARMGLSALDLAAARAECLPSDERAAWGRYYDDAPRVLVGKVSEGYRVLIGSGLPAPRGSTGRAA